MLYIVVEYIVNICDDVCIFVLLCMINVMLIVQGGVFLIGGIWLCVIELYDYCVVDGMEDDVFVYVMLKIGLGCIDVQKKVVCDVLFDVIKVYFVELYVKCYFVLLMELIEFSESGLYKYNNIYVCYKWVG